MTLSINLSDVMEFMVNIRDYYSQFTSSTSQKTWRNIILSFLCDIIVLLPNGLYILDITKHIVSVWLIFFVENTRFLYQQLLYFKLSWTSVSSTKIDR